MQPFTCIPRENAKLRIYSLVYKLELSRKHKKKPWLIKFQVS